MSRAPAGPDSDDFSAEDAPSGFELLQLQPLQPALRLSFPDNADLSLGPRRVLRGPARAARDRVQALSSNVAEFSASPEQFRPPRAPQLHLEFGRSARAARKQQPRTELDVFSVAALSGAGHKLPALPYAAAPGPALSTALSTAPKEPIERAPARFRDAASTRGTAGLPHEAARHAHAHAQAQAHTWPPASTATSRDASAFDSLASGLAAGAATALGGGDSAAFGRAVAATRVRDALIMPRDASPGARRGAPDPVHSLPFVAPSRHVRAPLQAAAPARSSRQKHQCDICMNWYANLDTHKLSHAPARPFRCAHCSRDFSRMNDLLRHARTHDVSGFRCPFWQHEACHRTGSFSRVDTFKRHMAARHFAFPPGTALDQRQQTRGKCRACGGAFASVGVWIAEHVQTDACPGLAPHLNNSFSTATQVPTFR